jgi:hypothetical protein
MVACQARNSGRIADSFIELIDIAPTIRRLSRDEQTAPARIICWVLRETGMDEKTPKASEIEYPPPEDTQLAAVFDADVQFVYANGFLLNVNVSDGEMIIALGVKQPSVRLAGTIKAGGIKFTHRIHLPLQVGMQIREVLNKVVASMEKMQQKISEGSTTKN